ncbi:tubulin-like doman-containing protein [Nocardiopsis rhodophaea]|uniref:tubulin-like doman-containing protein n=1 Tax=Nocardiopsis rhodophaea TaxID=280238 RepID=UPI0031D6BC33
MTMKLYQPMLYVGLGGTGCLIGAELERRLREELCGPDGTEFQQRRPGGNLLPYQLPSCVQFVYADVSRAELDRLPARVVPGRRHIAAAEQTAHYVRDLVPSAYTYPEAARSLRLSAGDVVTDWLPPASGEPRVSPLDRGAGQFPTVGRAALFETFRGGTAPAVGSLKEAINRLATSAGDLSALGGGLPKSCDVFVAFSVAGGTGAGIFYDYLHLIANTFKESDLRVKIYPLVLMPSAFDEGLGGGRNAKLNAGRALLDMFRLVDDQNSSGAALDLLDDSRLASGPRRHDDAAVRYPVEGRIKIAPSTVQTAFLFSRPTGADRDDLHRSVVSLVLSLAGTDMEKLGEAAGAASQETHQSFADSFINTQAEREVPAESGIGNRGVSTALVASMTVPVDELADIIGSRLLRAAVNDMRSPLNGNAERNRALIGEFFTNANIQPVLTRTGSDFAEPEPATGARAIAAALYDRGDSMKRSLAALRSRLGREVPELAQSFDHRAGARGLLAKVDPFHARRLVVGNSDASAEIEQLGAIGLLQSRRNAPPPPEGFGAAPPSIPELRDRLNGLIKTKYTDPAPARARADQDIWYEWQSRLAWSEAWSGNAPRWNRAATLLTTELTAFTDALDEHARTDGERFEQLAQQLYRPRTGVSYLLPPVGSDLEPFYRRAKDRLLAHFQELDLLRPNSTEADLVETIIGPEGWRTAYDISVDRQPTDAVAFLRETLKTAVKRFLRDPGPVQKPLLPRLADLLAHVTDQGDGSIADEDLNEFRAKLAALLPVGYIPQGGGPLKVLITYHAAAPNARIEQYLRESINLPQGGGFTYELRPVSAETVSVVLFRTSMSVTEVREVRDVMRLWADALRNQQPQDYLRWRQRLGFDFGYLATTEEHRVYILHRLLNALWNGRAHVIGDPLSPLEVRFVLGGGVTMPLQLVPLEETSSWGSLLRSYEHWAFSGEDAITRQFCSQLMSELPNGVEDRPSDPHDLYWVIRDMADDEVKRLDNLMKELHSSHQGRALQLRDFWSNTLPAALALEFQGAVAPIRANLRALEQVVSRRSEGGDGLR